jgi:hypothetical protein
MIHKEIMMHLIAYNCIQSLISEAVRHTSDSVRRISFKGSLQTIRQWSSLLSQDMSAKKRHDLIRLLYQSIAQNIVQERPGRSEPRAVKRRPKNHQLLTAPRHEMKVIPHRNKYQAQNA